MKYIEKHFSESCSLKGYLYEESKELAGFKKRPAVVVCPGGAYIFCSDREADPIATFYSGAGFNTFVFRYTVGDEAVFPVPLTELSVAMKYIREHAEEWGIREDCIAVCGFSAGGHLTASLGTLWNHPEIAEASDCANGENRPNALVLGYPVINTRSWMVSEVPRLTRGRDLQKTVELLDTEKNVGEHTPPAFIFHTYSDQGVAVEDSLCFANAMAAHDRPFELHVFTNGRHGMATGNALTDRNEQWAAEWLPMSAKWLWSLFGGADSIPFSFGTERKHPVNGDK